MTERAERSERLRAQAERITSDPGYLDEVRAVQADMAAVLATEPLTITIEDDDGFWSVWPAPEGQTLLRNPQYVGLCELMHETLREQWEAAGRPEIGEAP